MIVDEELGYSLYVYSSEYPQNIPVAEEFYTVPNHLVFDDTTPIGSDENGKN